MDYGDKQMLGAGTGVFLLGLTAPKLLLLVGISAVVVVGFALLVRFLWRPGKHYGGR